MFGGCLRRTRVDAFDRREDPPLSRLELWLRQIREAIEPLAITSDVQDVGHALALMREAFCLLESCIEAIYWCLHRRSITPSHGRRRDRLVPDSLAHWSHEPRTYCKKGAMLVRLLFGKHRDSGFNKAPQHYIHTQCDECNPRDSIDACTQLM
jgi:hypothetical protein